jgi:chromate reductase, NAD(P)H dehydrogenase (quinone)
MKRIIGISGSLRHGSFNSALLRAAGPLMPEDAELVIESLSGIPLYNFDVESSEGIPDSVARLQDALEECDGLLLSTPEYNNSIPGVLKNAIDWLSRPPDDIPRVFGELPVALMGASPGSYGTILSQVAWLPVLRTLGTEFWTGGRLQVARAKDVFDDNGELVDDAIRERLKKFLAGFVDFLS